MSDRVVPALLPGTREPISATLSVSLPPQSINLFVLGTGTANQPPVAPLVVSFDGTGSSDPDGSIASYAWSFGDGGTASGPTASHTYTATGTDTARLTVTDNKSATGSATATITVSPSPNAIAAPSNLTASASNSRVALNWRDNSNNETTFLVERAPSGSSSFVQVGQTAANAVTWAETIARGTYLYRVRAFNGSTGRYSAYSNQAQIRVK